jgi:hypothetical protein
MASFRNHILCFVLGLAAGAAVTFAGCLYIVNRDATANAVSLAAAQRLSDDARASYERLSERLGAVVSGMDGALAEAGRLGGTLERIRARDAVYEGVAKQIRDIADSLDKPTD